MEGMNEMMLHAYQMMFNELKNNELMMNEVIRNDMMINEMMMNEMRKNEAMKNGSLKDETVMNETMNDEAKNDETVNNETLNDEMAMNDIINYKTGSNETMQNETVKEEAKTDEVPPTLHIRKRRLMEALKHKLSPAVLDENTRRHNEKVRRETYEMLHRKLLVLEGWEICKKKALERLYEELQHITSLHFKLKEQAREIKRRGGDPDAALAEFAEFLNNKPIEELPILKKMGFDITQVDKSASNSHAFMPMPEKIQLAYDASPDDYVVIGPNGTKVAKTFLASLNWGLSGAGITRKFLVEVFDRDELALHSLSGKPSPAFMDMNRPKKDPLNAEIVADIIYFMTTYLDLKEKNVRNTITNKCADENKMFRQRMLKQIKRYEAAATQADKKIKLDHDD